MFTICSELCWASLIHILNISISLTEWIYIHYNFNICIACQNSIEWLSHNYHQALMLFPNIPRCIYKHKVIFLQSNISYILHYYFGDSCYKHNSRIKMFTYPIETSLFYCIKKVEKKVRFWYGWMNYHPVTSCQFISPLIIHETSFPTVLLTLLLSCVSIFDKAGQPWSWSRGIYLWRHL